MKFWKYAASLLSICAVMIVGLSRAGWPDQFWPQHPKLAVSAIVSAAVFATIDLFISAIKARREERNATTLRNIDELLKGTLVQIHKTTGLPWTDIGLHLFVVKKRWAWKLCFWDGDYQHHEARVKITAYPPPTGIRWTKGKGVIGLCWSKRAFQSCDLLTHYGPFQDCDAQAWSQLAEKHKYGLTYEEFLRDKEFAGAILAAPILTDRGAKYLGCVSIDAPGESFRQLNHPEVKIALQLAADTARGLVWPAQSH